MCCNPKQTNNKMLWNARLHKLAPTACCSIATVGMEHRQPTTRRRESASRDFGFSMAVALLHAPHFFLYQPLSVLSFTAFTVFLPGFCCFHFGVAKRLCSYAWEIWKGFAGLGSDIDLKLASMNVCWVIL